jgi:hypothetical protein
VLAVPSPTARRNGCRVAASHCGNFSNAATGTPATIKDVGGLIRLDQES